MALPNSDSQEAQSNNGCEHASENGQYRSPLATNQIGQNFPEPSLMGDTGDREE